MARIKYQGDEGGEGEEKLGGTMPEDIHDLFSVLAESKDYEKPLYLTDLTFARLLEDIIIPFDSGDEFFIDGISLSNKTLRKIKILRQEEGFPHLLSELHRTLRRGGPAIRKTYGEQYSVRLEAVLREGCEDVTSQILSAYRIKVKPSIKDWVQKRPELIQAASQFFLEALSILNKH